MLYPGYFALVIATGIVSTSAYLLEKRSLASLPFQANKGIYGILWILTIIRLILFRRLVAADLIDHVHGPESFRT